MGHKPDRPEPGGPAKSWHANHTRHAQEPSSPACVAWDHALPRRRAVPLMPPTKCGYPSYENDHYLPVLRRLGQRTVTWSWKPAVHLKCLSYRQDHRKGALKVVSYWPIVHNHLARTNFRALKVPTLVVLSFNKTAAQQTKTRLVHWRFEASKRCQAMRDEFAKTCHILGQQPAK